MPGTLPANTQGLRATGGCVPAEPPELVGLEAPTRLHRAALLLAVLSPGLVFEIPAF